MGVTYYIMDYGPNHNIFNYPPVLASVGLNSGL